MAINKNHEFEELNGIKCAIVEKNASQERVDFLKELLEWNKYEVVVVPTAVKAAPAAAPPKPAATATPPAQPAAAGPALPATVPNAAPVSAASPTAETVSAPPVPPPPPPPPPSFTIGVTDVTFNPINAIFGRLLKTKDGRIVTLGYWQQKEKISNDEIPYFGDVVNKGD